MKISYVNVLATVAALGFGAGLHAQQNGNITVEKKDNSPYAIDSQGLVWRNGNTLCTRTGSWSKEAAQTTRVVGSNLPVGCYCEKDQMAKDVCEPPVATLAAATPPKAAPAVLAPVPVSVPVAPTPALDKITLPADALFAFDKAEITETGIEKLGSFSDHVKSLNLEVITVVGHADRIGSDAYNQTLSEKRAAAVKDLLVAKGVEANRVYTEGKGKSQSVAGDSCKNMGRESGKNKKLVDCLAPDRRVELEAVGTKLSD
jgi:OOP family OmpA-OmpF porin